MLQKQHRLTRRKDFKSVFAGGRTYVHKLFILKVLRRRDERPSRFGFVTSANVGKAVARNRARRLFREAVRLLGDQIIPTGSDVAIIVRPPAREATFAEIQQAIQEQFRKAGLLRSREGAEVRQQSL